MGRWVWGGERPEEEARTVEPLSFLPVNMGCNHQTKQSIKSKGCDAGLSGVKPLLKCSREEREEEMYGKVQTGISFLPCDMSSPGFKEMTILLYNVFPVFF